MNVSYSMPVVAQQITGHPAALPSELPGNGNTGRVAPVAERQDASGLDLGLNRDEPSTPPSALQRKIMEILERQARELEQC